MCCGNTGEGHEVSRDATLHNCRNCRHVIACMNGGHCPAANHISLLAEPHKTADTQLRWHEIKMGMCPLDLTYMETPCMGKKEESEIFLEAVPSQMSHGLWEGVREARKGWSHSHGGGRRDAREAWQSILRDKKFSISEGGDWGNVRSP